jgi:hypothetical protein
MGLKKIYLLYIFPPWAPHTYDFVVVASLTHPRKNYFGCAANRKTGNRKSQRFTSAPTYIIHRDTHTPLRKLTVGYFHHCSTTKTHVTEMGSGSLTRGGGVIIYGFEITPHLRPVINPTRQQKMVKFVKQQKKQRGVRLSSQKIELCNNNNVLKIYVT